MAVLYTVLLKAQLRPSSQPHRRPVSSCMLLPAVGLAWQAGAEVQVEVAVTTAEADAEDDEEASEEPEAPAEASEEPEALDEPEALEDPDPEASVVEVPDPVAAEPADSEEPEAWASVAIVVRMSEASLPLVASALAVVRPTATPPWVA